MHHYGSGFAVMKMCRVLGVSRSGYYSYLRRVLSLRHEEYRRLVEKIKEIWHRVCEVYGSPRITAELRSLGLGCGRNRIARLMRENGIKARIKKRFKVTTQSDHSLPADEDLLKQNFSAQAPNEKFLSDINYIWTLEVWMYLAVVMDVYNREIVGWALHDRLKKELVRLKTFHAKDKAHRSVFEYIEIFYNRKRRHSALNHRTSLKYYREVYHA